MHSAECTDSNSVSRGVLVGFRWPAMVPRNGYFAILRLYSPTEAAFNKTWVFGDIKKAGGTERRGLLDLLGLLARHRSRARRPIMFTEKAGRGLLIVDLEKDVPEEMNRRQIAVKTAVARKPSKRVEADVAA